MIYGNHFAKRILERGYHYYVDGAVFAVIKDGNIYKATVRGTEDYQVEIKISDKFKVTEMNCTCPYAKDGKHCKHEAAVLLEIFGEEAVMGDMVEEDEYEEYYDYDEYEKDYDGDWEDDDDDFYEERVYQGHEILEPLEEKSKSDILEIISLAIQNPETYQVFLDLLQDDQRIENIQNMIHSNISSLHELNQKSYQKIYQAIADLYHYHQDNNIPGLAKEALCRMLDNYEILQSFQEEFFFDMIGLIEKGHFLKYEKNEIYNYLCVQYHQPVIYHFMHHLYKQNYSFQDIIRQLEEKIKFKWSRSSLTETCQKYIYILYYFQSSSFEKMIQKYAQERDFSMSLIKFYIQIKQYDKAQQLCINAINKKGPIEFYQLLIEIYQQTKQDDKMIDLYVQILCEKYFGNIQYYRQLKKMCSIQKWQQTKQKVIDCLEKKNVNLCAIYNEEEMYDALMNCFLKSHDMIEIKKYEDILFKEQTSKIKNLYRDFIMESLKQSGTREFYKNIACYIFKINEYDKQLAQQIVQELEQLYPKRYAMIEEVQIKETVPVSLSQIMEAIEMSNDVTLHVYRQSDGQILLLFEELDSDLIEMVIDDDDYIPLPSKYEMNEYHVMEKYIEQLADQNIKNILRDAICGKGAFRRFKNLIHHYHIQNDWYQFLTNEYRKVALRWCQKYNVSFVE